MPIREGLARLEGVDYINPRPDFKSATCELRWKNGALVDPLTFSNHVFGIRVGARLRGVEATVEGSLMKQGTNVTLRIGGTNAVLHLAPLRTKVQKDVVGKKLRPPTRAELKAYKRLLTKWKGDARTVLVTGPLVQKPLPAPLELEVRLFELAP